MRHAPTHPSGFRQTISVVYPAQLPAPPPWEEGPLPFQHGGRHATRTTRSSYFATAAAHVLYGIPERPCRWHHITNLPHGPLTACGVELLHTPTEDDPCRALAVIHLDITGPALHDILRSLAGRHAAGPSPLTGSLAPDELLQGHATTVPGTSPFTTAFLTLAYGQLPHLYPRPYRRSWPADQQWLWALASRTNINDYPPDPIDAPTLTAGTLRISADWSALVLRDGAAFIGRRPDLGLSDPFYGYARHHTRTVYLDALLLGIIQRSHIDQLTEGLSDIFDDQGHLARRVACLEHHIARFRSTYWRQHLTAHGPANDLLIAYQNQHRLPTRFNEILAEATDYARLAQSQESQQISGALGVLTILGIPLSTALAIQQVLADTSAWHLLAFIGSALAATAGLLTTPYGRLVLSSLRGPKSESGPSCIRQSTR